MAKVISKSAEELIDEYWSRELDHSRNVRRELLKAFDTYNISRLNGFSRTTYSLEEENYLKEWYFKILDLNYNAIFNESEIPPQVRYFLSKNFFEEYR